MAECQANAQPVVANDAQPEEAAEATLRGGEFCSCQILCRANLDWWESTIVDGNKSAVGGDGHELLEEEGDSEDDDSQPTNQAQW